MSEDLSELPSEETAVEAQEIYANETKEETPVIDVHTPQGGMHTWKDFWIHLGTITLGLLIAISLEQSVEWLSHRHQRHQLEADLHVEALRDHTVAVGDLRTFAVEREWLLGLRDQVDKMRDSGGKLKLPYPAKPTVDPKTKGHLQLMTLPSEAVWSTAKESELVVLIPRAEAEMYARHALQHEFLTNAVDGWIESTTEQTAFEDQFDDAAPTSAPDLTRMTPAQLNEYSVLLSRNLAFRDRVANRIKLFDSQTQAILGGARSEEDLMKALDPTTVQTEK